MGEPRSPQEQLILDLWQTESAEERRRLLQAHADQLSADLVATLHAYANEANKMGEHRTAWDLLAISREVAQCLGSPKLMGDCYSQAGLLHFHQGALNDARQAWETALSIYEPARASESMAACLTNLGIVSRNLGNLIKARDCETKALALHRQLNLPQGEVLNLGQLGLIFHELGDAQQGLLYLEQALELSRVIGYRQAEADRLGNIGVMYRDQGDIIRALEYLEQALATHRELGDQQGEANQLGNVDQLRHTILAAPPNVAAELLQRERELLIALRGKDAILRKGGADERQWQLFVEVEEMQRQLDLIWADLERGAPDYVALRRGATMPLAQIQALLRC